MLYVDGSAPPGGVGTVASPFDDMLDAFGVALDGWCIEVAPGTYVGPRNRELQFSGRNLHLVGAGGSSLCIFDLQQSGTAFQVSGQLSDASITGFTIENGSNSGVRVSGGSFIRLEDCVIRDCQAPGAGGGLWSAGKSLLVSCKLLNNQATGTGSRGGGIYASGNVEAVWTTFNGNNADLGGAVFRTSSPAGKYAYCIFRSNVALTRGGALLNERGSMTIDNSYFSQNSVTAGGGGAIWNGNSSLLSAFMLIRNCTLVNNDAGSGTGDTNGGGACYLDKTGHIVLRNSILWSNTAAVGAQIRLNADSGWQWDLDMAYSDLQGGVPGLGIVQGSVTTGPNLIDLDPLFVNPALGDYHLGPGSPCVDAGKDLDLPRDDFDVDRDGNFTEFIPYDLLVGPRQKDDLGVIDTGLGAVPISDMGVLER